jgi:hypothetical protein
VIRQLYQPGDRVTVYLTGGAFSAGETLLAPYHSVLSDGWPAAEVRQPLFPPVIGGLILASRSIDGPTDGAWIETVRATLDTGSQ